MPIDPKKAVSDGGAGVSDAGDESEDQGPADLADPKKSSDDDSAWRERLLAQRKKDQARIRELERAQKERDDAELVRKGDIEKMLENERQRAKELADKLSLHEEKERTRTKAHAVARALGKFWNQKLVNLVDFESVVVDPDSGEIDELSVKKEVDRIKKEWPELLVDQRKPGLPNGAPRGLPEDAGKISEEKWRALPVAEKKKWKMNQIQWGE